MELVCEEQMPLVNTATNDPVIFQSQVVWDNLLRDEVLTVPNCDYFQKVQTDIQPFMRKVVTTWMLEVCEEQMCEDQVLPLAINCMDRFLCVCAIKRQQLQLLGATCLLIASKVRSTTFLPVDLLCAYTDYSVTHEHIINWELLVLSKLEWNLSAITGFDFVDHIIERCSWGGESGLLRRHAHTLVTICATEPNLIQTLPSVIAAACISSAINGLKLSSATVAFNDICTMVNVDRGTLELLVGIIDSTIESAVQQQPSCSSSSNEKCGGSSSNDGYESPQYGQPNTPTEVENIYF